MAMRKKWKKKNPPNIKWLKSILRAIYAFMWREITWCFPIRTIFFPRPVADYFPFECSREVFLVPQFPFFLKFACGSPPVTHLHRPRLCVMSYFPFIHRHTCLLSLPVCLALQVDICQFWGNFSYNNVSGIQFYSWVDLDATRSSPTRSVARHGVRGWIWGIRWPENGLIRLKKNSKHHLYFIYSFKALKTNGLESEMAG